MEPYTLKINIAAIQPSRWQPRRAFDAAALYELACSIRDQGLINPVLVFPVDGCHELIAGERRTRAAAALALSALFEQHDLSNWCARLANVGLAGMGEEERAALAAEPGATILTKVYPSDDLAALHLIAVTENLDRADLTPVEEAYAYKGLLDEYGWTQRELAGHINKSQGYIAQRIALLNLNEKATNALNTRVISMSHARAIAAVPEALQQAATDYVVHAVVREDSPATTRQVENQMRALAAFVDPARWEPDSEYVYTAQQRNRLAVIQMLLSGPHAAERVAQNLDTLLAYKSSYETKNLLTAKPLTIVIDRHYYTGVVTALGMRPQDAWDNHCLKAGKTCDSCVFQGVTPAATCPGVTAFCARWRDADTRVCENYSSPAWPTVIDNNDYEINGRLRETQAYVNDPFPHTTSVAAYVTAYEAVVADHIARDAQRQQDKVDGPRRAIQAFWEWQQTLPAEWRAHSQAHACERCRYYEPLTVGAPCRFALNPIGPKTSRDVSWNMPRPPKFGVLVSSTLTLLPRCEMFTLVSGHLPEIYQQPGFSVAPDAHARKHFMQWFYGVKAGRHVMGWLEVMWRGPLAWLCTDGDNYDFESIINYLYKRWDEIGDGGMATLLDALMYEAKVCYDTRNAKYELVNLRDGKLEEWAGMRFENRNEETRSWPVGWPKPWEAQ